MRRTILPTLLWGSFFLILSLSNAYAAKEVPPAPPFEAWLQELKGEAL